VVYPVSQVIRVGPGTLKLVISSARPEAVLAALQHRVDAENIHAAVSGALLVHSALEPSELRDMLSRELGEGDSLLIVEFEKWSGYGAGIDREWLRARGH
jgi:hypothetical protein